MVYDTILKQEFTITFCCSPKCICEHYFTNIIAPITCTTSCYKYVSKSE